MNESKNPGKASQQNRRRAIEMTAVFLFLGVSVFAPFLIGECYPITISPMFCEQPETYCEYRVTNPDGKELDLELFSLHRVYDGNPQGLGVGLIPAYTLNKPDEIPGKVVIERFVRKGLENCPDEPWVTVEQRVFGEVDGSIGEIQPANKWKIDRSGIIQ